jgi:hypothetical protein
MRRLTKALLGTLAAVCVLGVTARSERTLGAKLIEKGHVEAVNVEPVANDLQFLWEHTDSVEWLACAQGRMSGDTLYITDLGLANMTAWTPIRVEFDGCPKRAEFVGTIHPHKGSDPTWWRCQFSDQDMTSFIDNPDEALMFVECDTGRLVVSMLKVKVGRDSTLKK